MFNCTSFDDRSAAAANRTITFDFTVSPRCIRVKAGQQVTMNSVSSIHPVNQTCGPSTASMLLNLPGGQSSTVTMSVTGLYGFICQNHSTMTGAIDVIP